MYRTGLYCANTKDRNMIEMEKREKAVRRVLDGEPIAKVGRSLNVSRGSIHSWLNAYKADGSSGLFPKSTRPITGSKSLGDRDVERIIQRALDYPSKNIRSLGDTLADEGSKVAISTIHKYLSRAKLITSEKRIERLLDDQERKGISSLSKQSLESLETHCPHFADRNKFEKTPGTKFLVTLKTFRIDNDLRKYIPVWYFIDLHRLMVTAIVNDDEIFDAKQDAYHQQLIPLNERQASWGEEIVTPIAVWRNVYKDALNKSGVELLFLSNLLEERVKSAIVQSHIFSDISFLITNTLSELPTAFLDDLHRLIMNIYNSARPELKNISDKKRRFHILTNEIKTGLIDYNSTPLKYIFPLSKQTPAYHSLYTELIKDNPIVSISEYLQHKYEGATLFYEPDEYFGKPSHKMILARYGLDPAIFENLDADIQSTLVPPRYGYIRPKVPKLNHFQRAQQELRILEYTDLKTSSDLKRLSEKIPFILVYLCLMRELPQGRYYTCPRCNKKSMYYYARPKEGYKSANIGRCFKNKGGCNKTTSSINLLYYKSELSPQRAFKWFLANFDPWIWGVDTDFQLSKRDEEEYRHIVEYQETFMRKPEKRSDGTVERYGRQELPRSS
jgi:hypothetical protein